MQRAASVVYTSTTDSCQTEQPLLHFLLPNKVEYYCNTNQDPFSKLNVSQPNPRRHSAGNCNTENESKKPTSPAPPPVPARLNKAPAVPERKTIKKSDDPLTPPPQNGISSAEPSAAAPIAVKLPPPPQSTSKRASFSRTNPLEPNESDSSDQTAKQNQRSQPMSNGTTLTPLQHTALFNSLQNKSTDEGYFKFPKMQTPSVEDNETFSSVRRKSGKKIPPPIHTYTNQVMDDTDSPTFESNSKMSITHDSTLSCSDGGVSQTSSPSYLIRSLESPLLPKVHSHSTNRYTKRKFITGKLFSDINEFAIPKDNKISPPDLTKSQSTPGGLQTVVDYQQGANLPYQHKVIRNEKNTPYLSRSQLKFQFLQILINVVVLLAVAGALVCYFRAYPAVIVTYINQTNLHSENLSQRLLELGYHHSNNEIDYSCIPVKLKVPFCPYELAAWPNYIDEYKNTPVYYQFMQEMDGYSSIANVRCYQLAPLYICSLYLPKCGFKENRIGPCRSLCSETNRRCGLFFEVFGLDYPKTFNCDEFPDSNDTNVCIVCDDGFKCDKKRCIPADWRCDGHIDCEDETDENNCEQCPGKLHCGNGQCIATDHICDGRQDCPWGQDERNCVRLNQQMGNNGYGSVEIFVAQSKAYKTACVSKWDTQNSPLLVCKLMGYKNYTRIELLNKTEHTKLNYIQYNKEFVEYNKLELFENLKDCQNNGSYPTISAICSGFECGVRKKTAGQPRIRIIGGTQAKPGDWPFLVAILGGPLEIFYCAGVLISDEWVLSAAHCIGNFNLSLEPVDWTIHLGMTRRSSHTYFGQKLKIRRVIPHPHHNRPVAHDNDIALFQLKEKVKFHDHLIPVCMPSSTTILQPPRKCTVIGWGKSEDSEASNYELTINEVQVPILNHSLCHTWLKLHDYGVTSRMICAGLEDGGKDACQGDSGGPLLCQYDDGSDRWFVGGIVSWGIHCANAQLPGIYANVPIFVDWIEYQMEKYSGKSVKSKYS